MKDVMSPKRIKEETMRIKEETMAVRMPRIGVQSGPIWKGMEKTWFLLLVLAIAASPVYATMQTPDRLQYRGRIYRFGGTVPAPGVMYNDFADFPLQEYFYGLPKKQRRRTTRFFKEIIETTGECLTTACSRGYIATWEVDDGILYLKTVYDGDKERPAAALKPIFGDRVKGNRIEAFWFTGPILVGQEILAFDRGKLLETVVVDEESQMKVFLDIKNRLSQTAVIITKENQPQFGTGLAVKIFGPKAGGFTFDVAVPPNDSALDGLVNVFLVLGSRTEPSPLGLHDLSANLRIGTHIDGTRTVSFHLAGDLIDRAFLAFECRDVGNPNSSVTQTVYLKLASYMQKADEGVALGKELRGKLFSSYTDVFAFIARVEMLAQDNATLMTLASDSRIDRRPVEGIGQVLIVESDYYGTDKYNRIRGAQMNGRYFVLRVVGDKLQLIGVLQGNGYRWSHAGGVPRLTTSWHSSADESGGTTYTWNGSVFEPFIPSIK